MKIRAPYIIDFNSIGSKELGYISIAEGQKDIPFDIKRVYWNYYTPSMITRGRHAHYELEQIFVAVSGTLTVSNENLHNEVIVHILDSPNKGVYIPKLSWHTVQFSDDAVMMSLASMEFKESDYIREYNDFLKIKMKDFS